jgi:hypothetical protein
MPLTSLVVLQQSNVERDFVLTVLRIALEVGALLGAVALVWWLARRARRSRR